MSSEKPSVVGRCTAVFSGTFGGRWNENDGLVADGAVHDAGLRGEPGALRVGVFGRVTEVCAFFAQLISASQSGK